MAILQDWKIRSRSMECSLSGNPFEDGDEFYTCIFEDPETEGYLRQDYAAENWEQVQEKFETPPFSFWKSTFEIPQKEVLPEAIEKHSAEALLRRMIEEDDPATENARYILAVMLERKKTLKPVDTKETETRKLLFYEHKDSGDLFIVADPQLHLSEIESVQEEVSALLKAGDVQKSASVSPSQAFTIWTLPYREPSPGSSSAIPSPSLAFTIWTLPFLESTTLSNSPDPFPSRAFTIWTIPSHRTDTGE